RLFSNSGTSCGKRLWRRQQYPIKRFERTARHQRQGAGKAGKATALPLTAHAGLRATAGIDLIGKSVPDVRILTYDLQAIRSMAPQTGAALAGSLVYLLLSVYSGSLLRNSFDDEIDTLIAVQEESFAKLVQFRNVADAHTPLSYLVFKVLWTVWPSIYV